MVTPAEAARVGELLIEEGVITQEELVRAVAEGGIKGTPLAALLEQTPHVRRADLAAFLAQEFRVPQIEDLRRIEIRPDVARLIPEDLARKHEMLPVAKLGGILCVAKSNYFNRAAIQELRNVVDIKIKVLQADEEQVRAAIDRAYKNKAGELPAPASARGGQKPPTVRRVFAPAPAPAARPAPQPAMDEAAPAAISAAPRGGFDEVIEILDAIRIPSQDYVTALKDPFARMVVEFDDVFLGGRMVTPSRV
jgi:hypothetical protein